MTTRSGHHRCRATILGLALCALAPAAAADVVVRSGAVWLTGEIKPRDLQALAERRREGLVVHLDTRGGQLTSAVAIGRLLRMTRAAVRVDAGSHCLSACVFVLAGAPFRVVEPGAVVAVHKPYDDHDPRLPLAERQMKEAKLEAFVKAYFKEVNVRPTLYEAMLNAPQGRELPPSELAWYGLNANDRKLVGAGPER